MANLKEIRNRISSVSSKMQITSAMKMVSAAKLKKAQDAITAMRPYSDKLTQMLVNLSSSVDFENVYLSPRKVKNKLVVCITSNRGLCGAFNSNVIKKCTEIANSSDESVSFLCIGKKGADILSKNYNVVQTNNEIFDDLTFENISAIAEKLMSMFLNKEFALSMACHLTKDLLMKKIYLFQQDKLADVLTENMKKIGVTVEYC